MMYSEKEKTEHLICKWYIQWFSEASEDILNFFFHLFVANFLYIDHFPQKTCYNHERLVTGTQIIVSGNFTMQ